jgi:hypothetical protein
VTRTGHEAQNPASYIDDDEGDNDEIGGAENTSLL